jgi:hypothetical protein
MKFVLIAAAILAYVNATAKLDNNVVVGHLNTLGG